MPFQKNPLMQSEHKQPQIEFQFSTDSIFSDTTLYMSRVTDNYTTSCHFLCCVLQEMIFEIFLNAFLASLFIKYRPKRNQSFFFLMSLLMDIFRFSVKFHQKSKLKNFLFRIKSCSYSSFSVIYNIYKMPSFCINCQKKIHSYHILCLF